VLRQIVLVDGEMTAMLLHHNN